MTSKVNEDSDIRSRALYAAVARSQVADVGTENPSDPEVGIEWIGPETAEADVCAVATNTGVEIVRARL
ncbi:hypothetical protein [Paraburkholderia youngii]|uniref:hypothetical protein n=1 Tax=Paraburkholderia youngii TaxID=2782701 RepID=UPI003D20A04E